MADAAPTSLPPRFETLTVSEGLTSNEGGGLLQDRQGFLWVATGDGLNRFDGATFTEFHHDSADPHSLGDDVAKSLFESRDGQIWIGTESGVDRYDPESESFTHFRHDPDDPSSIGQGTVTSIAEDAGGTLWIGTWGGGLNRYDPDTETFAHYRHDSNDPQSLTHDNVYALAPDPGGVLWVGTALGIVRIDPPVRSGQAAETLSRVDIDVTPFGGASYVTGYALCLDRTGALWIGTFGRGLVRYDPATGAARNYPAGPGGLGHPWVLSITEDRSGTLWVGTYGGGLHRYDADRDAFERFVHDPADASSVADDHVWEIAEDRTGVLWVSTDRGLCRRLPLSRVVAQERHRPGDPRSLSSDDVTAFVEDASGVLWVGTDGGLNRRDPATGGFERIRLSPPDATSGRDDAVRSLAADPNGTLWVGSGGGLFHRRGSGPFERFPAVDSAGDENFGLRSLGPLAVSPPGRLWVGSQYGLTEVASPAGPATTYQPVPSNTASNIIQSIYSLLPGPDGTLWAGGEPTALYRFDPVTETFTDVRTAVAGTPPEGSVQSLLRAHGGTLWLGTTRGLERRDEDGRWRRYGRAEGLPNTGVNGLLEDAEGHVWVTTNRGLARFDPRTETFQTYGARDGLQSDVWNEQAVYQSPRTGTFYVGGDRGYNAFDPSAIPDESPPPAPVLTGLRLSGVLVPIAAEASPLRRALSMTDRLRLRYDDRVVTFSFAALDFRAPGAQRYAVRLDGFEDDWRDLGGQREATFTNLSPGHYTFRVRAAGRDGVWGEETALAVTVVPPWWRAWWAYLGYALLALGMLTAAYRARRQRHELRHRMEIEHIEAEKLRELDHARSRFFANVSHEFRTPLTLTLGPLDDLKAGLYGPLPAPMAEQVGLARRNAARVLDLVNQILDIARLEAGRMPLRARPLDLGAFVETVMQAFRPLAERKAMAFEASLPPESVEVWADPEQLEKVIGNLVSNALKFTPEGGTVRVTVEAEGATEGVARVVVRDSGPGIPADELPYVFDRFHRVNEGTARMQPGTGIGLALAREIVDLHGGTISVESEEGFGSTFTLTLPLGRAHLAPDQIDETPEDYERGRDVSLAVMAPLVTSGDGSTDGPGEDDDVTTVLVVEDHPEVRAYVRRHLEPDYRVLEAADGETALALARERLPDLVVSDVMMPGTDGLALCRALKADPETDFIPVILLTAKAEQEDRLDGLSEHCDDYLTKPFDPAELRARVENLIAGRRRLRERFAGAPPRTGSGDGLLHPAPVEVDSAEAAFLDGVRAAIEDGLADETFSVERLAEGVGMSRSHLHRQLTALAGQTPSEAIRTMRLERAAQLLEAGAGTVSEVAYAVGFKSVAHFSNRFEEHFGCRPSVYPAQA